MRIAFFIHTPAQVYFWGRVILALKKAEHEVIVLSRNDGQLCELLNLYSIRYFDYGQVNKTIYGKLLQLPIHAFRCLNFIKKTVPDILVGPGVIEGYVSVLLRKPLISFWDSEPIIFLERFQEQILTNLFFTPENFKLDLGHKHIRLLSYKELAYLHPNYFQPDPSILNELGLDKNEKYVVLRFNAFDAVHDIGRRGFSLSDKYRLVQELEKYARVFIRSEIKLPDDLAAYNLPISFERLHHALYFAQLLVTDTQTMTTEAAILGTPAIRCNNFVGPNDMGNFIELEQKYGLIYNYREPDKALVKAVELIQKPGLKTEWKHKREILLKDKMDVTAFMAWFIENYPESYKNIKENPELQYSFR